MTLNEAYLKYGNVVFEEKMGRRKIRRAFGLTKSLANDLAKKVKEEGPPHPRQAKRKMVDEFHMDVEASGRVETLEDLLRHLDVDLDVWRVADWHGNVWEQHSVLAGLVPLYQVKARFERRMAAIHPPPHVTPAPRAPTVQPRFQRVLFVPDSQHGFMWSDNYRRLVPFHDPVACDLAVQVIKLWQPHVIVFHGDHLDLAEVSTKFSSDPRFLQTTQPAIDAVHWWLAQCRKAAPHARMIYVEGNHDARIRKHLVEKSKCLADLRAARDRQVALSIPRLLALDTLDVEYVGPYGKSLWLGDDLEVTHGTTVRQGGGSTASAVLKRADHSIFYGHVHKVEIAHKTLKTREGWRNVAAGSAGCLCRTDGTVPGYPGSPDWQQGLGGAYMDVETGDNHFTVAPILNGRIVWEGRVLQGHDTSDECAKDTDWPQMADWRSDG